MVFDGNPIYLLAQHFFASHGIHFDVTQVIGLTNDDPVSEEYRPLKQVIERLNRTLKRYYKSTNGFGAFDNCQNYLTLFTTWHNFLRPHKSLGYRVPVNIPGVTKLPNMPAKWLGVARHGTVLYFGAPSSLTGKLIGKHILSQQGLFNLMQ
jgi:putative transposase